MKHFLIVGLGGSIYDRRNFIVYHYDRATIRYIKENEHKWVLMKVKRKL